MVLHQLPLDTLWLLQEVIPAQGPRASSRKRPGVDFSKLEVRLQQVSVMLDKATLPQASDSLVRSQTASLRKYRTFYKLQDVAASSSKEDLIPAVAKHFAQQVRSTAT